jgi:hypothetical protein
MSDGRTVQFGKKQQMKKVIIRDTTGRAIGVRFDFANGETVMFEGDAVRGDVYDHLAMHGAAQKIGDECATLEKVADYVEAVREMIDRLYGGSWTVQREGGFAGVGVLVAALVEVYGKTAEEVRAILKVMKPAERNALRTITEPPIKQTIDRMETEAAKGTDSASLLAKFQ